MPSLRFKWACPTQCSLLKAQKAKGKKEVPWPANYGTRPLTQYQAPWHQDHYQAPWRQAPRYQAPQYQAPWSHVPWHQASQHQRPQRRFVPANHSGKSKIKSKHSKWSQKVEDDQYYREPPIWMQSMMEWMGQQMKSCQQPHTGRQAWVRMKGDVHLKRGNVRT
jgi:hypothetical protein